MEPLKLSQRGEAVLLDVLVTPRASQSAVQGVLDGRLKVALRAPPVDGEANAALVALIAKRLGIPKRNVALVGGQGSRRKTLALTGVDAAAVRALGSPEAR